MLRSTLFALVVAPVIVLGADDKPPIVKEDEFQGTWVTVKSYKANGEELSPESIKESDHRVTFTDDKMTNTNAGQRSAPFKIAIDPSKSPKEINWTVKEGTPPRLGIYRVNDDTLEIAWGGLKDGRPTALTPCPKDSSKRWTYGLYRREKQEKSL